MIDAEHIYKAETGSFPKGEIEVEFRCWRSKGQWVIDISDEERLGLFGKESMISFEMPDPDYIKWLEDKVMELYKNK